VVWHRRKKHIAGFPSKLLGGKDKNAMRIMGEALVFSLLGVQARKFKRVSSVKTRMP